MVFRRYHFEDASEILYKVANAKEAGPENRCKRVIYSNMSEKQTQEQKPFKEK